ncbi:glycosyltransferase family 2 protein [Curvivirga sp.]|uniref:glycosyltransferase family 2 protein n=1 Tax=Curvivirga sp. TaxID=2856848 RepID=UPI003B5B24C4
MSVELSALVVAHNEEKQLAACLESLMFADQLVVVLDKCTDRSKEIAESFNAKTVEGSWPIEGDRRNVGLDACDGQWIIELDADERVTSELANEIKVTLSNTTAGYFLLPFDNYVGERLVRYGWGCSWGVSAAPRLHKKGNKRWGQQRVHPSIELIGEKQELKGRIDHYVDRNISDMIKRLDSYTNAKAKDLREHPDGVGYARNIRRFFSRFIKCYYGRKGYREGKYGFLIALMAGLYPILSYLKANLEDE